MDKTAENKDFVILVVNSFDERITEVYGPYTEKEAEEAFAVIKKNDMNSSKSDDMFKNAVIEDYGEDGYSIYWGDDTYTDVKIQQITKDRFLSKDEDYYKDTYISAMKSMYIEKYGELLELYSTETKFKGPFKKWHELVYNLYMDKEDVSEELNKIESPYDWSVSSLVANLNKILCLEIEENGEISYKDYQFDVDEEVGCNLYHYETPEEAVFVIESSNVDKISGLNMDEYLLNNENKDKVLEVLKNLDKEKEEEYEGEER